MGKLTDKTALVSVDGAADYIPIVDVSDTSEAASGTGKKVLPNNLPVSTAQSTAISAAIEAQRILEKRNEFVDAVFSPAYVDDVPVITQATSETTALSSPAAAVPYIVGTGAQITGSDGQSDTNIRFAPGSFASGNGGSNDYAMYGEIKPGGSGAAARWPIIATFNTHASNTVVEVCFYSLINNNQLMPLIEVNGKLLSDYVIQRTVTGLGWKFTMTFPTAKSRRITLYCFGGVGLKSINCPTGQAITKPSDTISRRVAIIGDSFAGGASIGFLGGANEFETFMFRIARILGADEILHAAIGGTGFEAGTGTSAYYTRLSFVLGKSPHVLLVNGSINDGTAAGTIQASVASFLASASSVTEVVVVGTTSQSYEANHDAVEAATLAAGRTFIDMRSFFTGTGRVGDVRGDGNNDYYQVPTAADPHKSLDGHRAAAKEAYRRY